MPKVLIGIIIFFVIFLNTNDTIAETISGWLTQKNGNITTRDSGHVKKEPILAKSQLLDVPLINQLDPPRLFNGCEVTSLAMILNYNGIKVTKNELAGTIKTVPLIDQNNKKGNPNIGFVGDMANGPGMSVYNGPIFDLAQKYAGKHVVNLTNRTFEELLKQVSRGFPVWVITTRDFEPSTRFQKWDTEQGTIFITYDEHSAVITGYDQNNIYVNDPYGYKNRKVDRVSFIDSWEQMGKQAIVIEK